MIEPHEIRKLELVEISIGGDSEGANPYADSQIGYLLAKPRSPKLKTLRGFLDTIDF